jgi:hypothetical protein
MAVFSLLTDCTELVATLAFLNKYLRPDAQ